MPWIKQDDCIGCGLCVENCPQNTILMREDKADIDMTNCIRCGQCHDICPQNAVAHDKERVPIEVKANREDAKRLIACCPDSEHKKGFLKKLERDFEDKLKILHESMAEIKKLQI